MYKLLLTFFIFLAMPTESAYAGGEKYDWLLENLKNSGVVVDLKKGKIDGEEYTALIANRLTNEEKDYHPIILIFTNKKGVNAIVAEIDLNSDSTIGYSIDISNNSIFLRSDTAHHGVYFSKYQFKIINNNFYLVGNEFQSITPSVYGVSEKELNDSDYKEVEMWSGTSVNFLTSKADCWIQTFDLKNGKNSTEWKEWEAALDSLDKGHRATKGVNKQINFLRKKLIPLSDFEFFKSYTSFACYFDHKKKFHGQ